MPGFVTTLPIVQTAPPLGTLAVFLLEPESDDGLATWNFFDAVIAEGKDEDQEPGPEEETETVRRVIARATERLAGKDFAELSQAELLMLSGLMRKLTLAVPMRRSRRPRPTAHGGSTDLRATLLDRGRQLNWVPPHMRHRYEHWVGGLTGDWLISRQRFFGVPFPIWYGLDDSGEPDYSKLLMPDVSTLPVDPSSASTRRRRCGGRIVRSDNWRRAGRHSPEHQKSGKPSPHRTRCGMIGLAEQEATRYAV